MVAVRVCVGPCVGTVLVTVEKFVIVVALHGLTGPTGPVHVLTVSVVPGRVRVDPGNVRVVPGKVSVVPGRVTVVEPPETVLVTVEKSVIVDVPHGLTGPTGPVHVVTVSTVPG